MCHTRVIRRRMSFGDARKVPVDMASLPFLEFHIITLNCHQLLCCVIPAPSPVCRLCGAHARKERAGCSTTSVLLP